VEILNLDVVAVLVEGTRSRNIRSSRFKSNENQGIGRDSNQEVSHDRLVYFEGYEYLACTIYRYIVRTRT
jgi:hypothetical protein